MKPNLYLLGINYTVHLSQIDIQIASMEIYFDYEKKNG